VSVCADCGGRTCPSCRTGTNGCLVWFIAIWAAFIVTMGDREGLRALEERTQRLERAYLRDAAERLAPEDSPR